MNYKGLVTPEPDIKLPSFAMVFRLKDSEKMQPQFKVLFQSLIGFLNVTGAMQRQPPLDINFDKRGDGKLVSTTYLPDKATDGKINYNFSPTIGFFGDRFIVSSTSRLAEELVDLAATAKPSASAEGQSLDNTRVALNVPALRSVLQDNRKHLVAQNQLEKGHPKEQAEKEIDALLNLLSAVRDMSLRVASDGKNLNLELSLRLEPLK